MPVSFVLRQCEISVICFEIQSWVAQADIPVLLPQPPEDQEGKFASPCLAQNFKVSLLGCSTYRQSGQPFYATENKTKHMAISNECHL